MQGRRRESGLADVLAISVQSLSVLILLFAGPAPSLADFYVNNLSGDDRAPGTEQRPWKTIQKAAREAMPGDTIFIVGSDEHEAYHEAIVPVRSGTEHKRITYRGWGERPPLIRGDGSGVVLSVRGKQYISITNLILTGPAAHGIEISFGSQNIEVDHVEITDIDHNGILVRSGKNIRISDCVIENTGNSGIVFLGSRSNPLENTAISGCHISNIRTNDGITLHLDSEGYGVGSGHLIERNVISDCAENGIDITAGNSVRVIGNITQNNGDSGILIAHGVTDVLVQHHQSISDIKYGVIVANSGEIGILDSQIVDTRQRAALLLQNSYGLDVSRNTITGRMAVRMDIVGTISGAITENLFESRAVKQSAMLRCLRECSFDDLGRRVRFRGNRWRRAGNEIGFASNSDRKISFEVFSRLMAPTDTLSTLSE